MRRVEELEKELANSVPKSEFDAVISNLELEKDDLERRLSDSVPRADLEYIKAELQRVSDLEGRYPIHDEETEELRGRIIELEKLLQLDSKPGTSAG